MAVISALELIHPNSLENCRLMKTHNMLPTWCSRHSMLSLERVMSAEMVCKTICVTFRLQSHVMPMDGFEIQVPSVINALMFRMPVPPRVLVLCHTSVTLFVFLPVAAMMAMM